MEKRIKAMDQIEQKFIDEKIQQLKPLIKKSLEKSCVTCTAAMLNNIILQLPKLDTESKLYIANVISEFQSQVEIILLAE